MHSQVQVDVWGTGQMRCHPRKTSTESSPLPLSPWSVPIHQPSTSRRAEEHKILQHTFYCFHQQISLQTQQDGRQIRPVQDETAAKTDEQANELQCSIDWCSCQHCAQMCCDLLSQTLMEFYTSTCAAKWIFLHYSCFKCTSKMILHRCCLFIALHVDHSLGWQFTSYFWHAASQPQHSKHCMFFCLVGSSTYCYRRGCCHDEYLIRATSAHMWGLFFIECKKHIHHKHPWL